MFPECLPHPSAGCDLLDLLVVGVHDGVVSLNAGVKGSHLCLVGDEQSVVIGDLLLQGLLDEVQAVQMLADLTALQSQCH